MGDPTTDNYVLTGGFFDVAHSLRADGFDASEDGTGRGTPLVPIAFSCKDSGLDSGETSPTLRSMNFDQSHANGGGQVAVSFVQNTRDEVRLFDGDGQSVGALAAEPGMKQQAYIAQNRSVMTPAMQVRRLTPIECERLQGFPDNYTKISEKTADGPRYKALGNSMAVPCMSYIGKRIQLVDLFS